VVDVRGDQLNADALGAVVGHAADRLSTVDVLGVRVARAELDRGVLVARVVDSLKLVLVLVHATVDVSARWRGELPTPVF
jgi:hypothetical protein